MSIEKAKVYLRQFGAEDRVIEFPVDHEIVRVEKLVTATERIG